MIAPGDLPRFARLGIIASIQPVFVGEYSRFAEARDVPGRIARLLVDFANENGSDAIEKALTHQTIAQMIGSSRETVSRTMRNLVERGIIQVTRKDITLQDRRSLMLAARRS